MTDYSGMQKTGEVTYTPGEPGDSQNAVVITQPVSGKAPQDEPTTAERPSAIGPIILSCFVTWCCCLILGLIAFIFVIYAGTKEVHSEYRKFLALSKKLSIAGIVVGVILIIISVVIKVAAKRHSE